MEQDQAYSVAVSGINLVRGLPGSGKTTWARQLAQDVGGDVFEADQYFEDRDGVYRFNPKKLPQAHASCLERTRAAVVEGRIAFVSNTFTRVWEMQKYIDLAEELDVPIAIHEVSTPWCKDADECARRNTHGVPQASIAKMLARWEDAPFETRIPDSK